MFDLGVHEAQVREIVAAYDEATCGGDAERAANRAIGCLRGMLIVQGVSRKWGLNK